MKNKKSKFVLGAIVGAAAGLLFAPQKGTKTRKELKKKMDDLIEKVSEVDIEEVKVAVENKIAEIKTELETLDKEKVLKVAKEQAKKVKKIATELVEVSVEKSTPVIEEIAKKIKATTIKATKEAITKLEEEEKES